MSISNFFSDPREIVDPDGLVHIGDEISTEILFEAYSKGIFPWPHDDLPILWFCPPERGVLFFDEFHISRSLIKDLKKKNWSFSINKDFEQVIVECAEAKRVGQDGTWITPYLMRHYKKFHQAGYAHSLECRDEEGLLIGAIYGVFIDGVFSGESMFFKKTNASKASLLGLIYILKSLGLKWIDIQMVTPLMQNFGGRSLERGEYLDLFELSKNKTKLLNDEDFLLQDILSSF